MTSVGAYLKKKERGTRGGKKFRERRRWVPSKKSLKDGCFG